MKQISQDHHGMEIEKTIYLLNFKARNFLMCALIGVEYEKVLSCKSSKKMDAIEYEKVHSCKS
ncbi:hypothetical protein CR513_18629, partial [Mucuna pruriens]